MAESTNPSSDNDLTRFQLRRKTWLQAQRARPIEAAGAQSARDVEGLAGIGDPIPPARGRSLSPDWPADCFDPSFQTTEEDGGEGPRGSHCPDGAGVNDPIPRTPSPTVDLSRFKVSVNRRLSDHSQGSHQSASARSEPLVKNPIAALISKSLPSTQEREQRAALTREASERQNGLARQVADSMSGMDRLTDLLANQIAPAAKSSAQDFSYFDLQERELRLKEQQLSLEERKMRLAETQAAFESRCANEGQDTIMKRANDYANMVARFISSGVSPQVAKELADETLNKFSQGKESIFLI